MFDPYARTVNRLGRMLSSEGDALPDAELLRRFAAVRDEGAFAALVRRHGALVFGVCRRTLGHVQDAEDAFQATFLVLSQKAGRVRGATLSRWLYGVAIRVSNKARVRRARRQTMVSDLDLFAAETESMTPDWLPQLDVALRKLADRDRQPILLCDLQGRTRAEAALELGIAEGTLSSRLARAREKLRRRLGRLGVALSTATLTTGLNQSAVGTVPSALLESTLAHAAGTMAVAARDLAEGVIRSMALVNFAKASLVGLCLAGTIAAGIVWAPSAGADPKPEQKEAAKPPAKVEAKPDTRPDADRLVGDWIVEDYRTPGTEGRATEKEHIGSSFRLDKNLRVTFAGFAGETLSLRIDPNQSPKHLDLEARDVPDGLKKTTLVLPGVYGFVGEKLHIVLRTFDSPDSERPKSLDAKDAGPKMTFLVLRPTTDSDRDRLWMQGEWREIGRTDGGLKILGRQFRLNFYLKGAFVLNASSQPKQIELTLDQDGSGLKKGAVLKGIYDINGSGLALAFHPTERPTNFRSDPANPNKFVFERATPAPVSPYGVSAPAKTDSAPKPSAANARIRHLKQERIKALSEQVDGLYERVRIGKVPLGEFIEAHREFCEAELEFATSQYERIRIRERLVEGFRTVEIQIGELQVAGLQSKQCVAQARAARLKAEIDLEKLKAEK